jgi:hypothetical protein
VSHIQTLVFQGRLPYLRLPQWGPTPAAQVILRRNGQETTTLLAVLDSGSSVTVFQPEMAELLGIDDVASSKVTQQLSTGGGPITIYLHDVEMELVLESSSETIACQIGFADRHIPRNILGRNLVFTVFTLAFMECNGVVLYSKIH